MIKYIFLSVIIFLYYLFSAFLFGSVFLKKIKIEFSLPLAMIVGRFLYFILFNVVALPMKLHFRPLSDLTIVWIVVITLSFIILWFYNLKYLRQKAKGIFGFVRKNFILSTGFLVLFLVQFIYISSQTAWVIGVTDDMYYIGDVSTSVYTNTIQQYNYLTGMKNSHLVNAYLIPMYPIHSAVITQLTGLPPLIENKWALTASWILLTDCMYLLWGQVLFKSNRKKIWGFMVAITWIFFCQRKAMGFFAMEMVYRTAEGKTLLVNLVVPFLYYLFTRIVFFNEKKQEWYILFIATIGSFCLVMSSMFILPFVLGSFYVCYILLGKKWRLIGPAMLCFFPCVVVLGIYLLLQKGILAFPVP